MPPYIPADHAPPMWAHQLQEFTQSAHLTERALWWEMRTGKTRVIIDTAAYQYENGLINALVVGAYPSSVHRNWAENEIPAYLPQRIPRRILFWRSSRASSKAYREELQILLTFKGLSVLTFNCEALLTDTLWKYLQKFCHVRKVLAVADEASWMASANASRSKRAEALARRAVTRRILEGTPCDEAPFDIFPQCNFLHRGILGLQHMDAFRARYGRYLLERDEDGNPIIDEYGLPKRAKQVNRRTGGTYEVLEGYQHLDELTDKILTIGSRVRREDVSDAPPKIYRKVRFDLTAAQRDAYDTLRDEYRLELSTPPSNRPTTLAALHPLARLSRLATLARGYWPDVDDTTPCPSCLGQGCPQCDQIGLIVTRQPRRIMDPKQNPAIEALTQELIATRRAPALVWARFHWDVADALGAVAAAGRKGVRYDGTVSGDARRRALTAFQSGEADVAVGTAAAAGRGLPWHRAETLIYYSNTYSLRSRRQSEDRAEHLDKTLGTEVIDLIAAGTVDEHVVDTLRAKRSVAEEVMSDKHLSWL